MIRDALMELTLSPLDKGESLSTYVARVLEEIDASGLPYRAGALGTTVEGTIDECLALARRCFDRLAVDCGRVSLSLRVDYRRGRSGRLDAKLASVEAKLGRPLRR